MTWPTDRPGYPLHPERDGWHWLKYPEDLRPFPSVWNAELQGWPSGALHSPQGIVDLGFAYLGPCPTPADLDAAVQAERVRLIGSCRAEMCRVRSMDHGPTPALDAALAQARREGREKAACLLEAIARRSDTKAQAYAKWFVKELRSAAAREEGK